MRVVITTRFDIEVGDRRDVEMVGQWLCERIAKGGVAEVFTGIAVVYQYPEHPIAGAGITIDNQWELVEAGKTPKTTASSMSSPFHPDAVSLLVASGEVAL